MRKTGQKPYRKPVKCKKESKKKKIKKNVHYILHVNGLCNNPMIIVFVAFKTERLKRVVSRVRIS